MADDDVETYCASVTSVKLIVMNRPSNTEIISWVHFLLDEPNTKNASHNCEGKPMVIITKTVGNQKYAIPHAIKFERKKLEASFLKLHVL